MIGPFREDWLAWGTVVVGILIFARGLYLLSLAFVLLVCGFVLLAEARKG